MDEKSLSERLELLEARVGELEGVFVLEAYKRVVVIARRLADEGYDQAEHDCLFCHAEVNDDHAQDCVLWALENALADLDEAEKGA